MLSPPFPKRWDSRNLEYLVQLWAYCDEIYHVISWRYSAIKRVYNLPPYLSYIFTLPDITQKTPKRDTAELKQRLNDTGPYSSGHRRRSDWVIDQWQTRLSARVKAKGRHFEHILWSSHTTGSFQSHWHYWEEDNITFRKFIIRLHVIHLCQLTAKSVHPSSQD